MARKQLSKNVGRMKRQQKGVGTGGVEKASTNAFNEIRTRKKFSMLGKKSKGDTKRTTQRRSAAVEKVCIIWLLYCHGGYCYVVCVYAET